MAALTEDRADLRQLAARDALEVAALRLEVDAEPDAREVEEGRHDGRLDDIDVGNADELSHEEGRSAHDRRHELAARRGSRLNGSSEILVVAEFLHHRDGQGARADNVGDGAAGNCAHEAGRQHGDFRRAAAGPAGDGIGKVDEELAEARRLQVSAEQDEQEDERRRDAERDAEDALCREVEVADELLDRQPAVREDARHVGTGKGVDQEGQHDADHRQADDAARRLDDEQDAQQTDNEVNARDSARAQHEMLILHHDVGRRRSAENGEQHIEGMHLVARPRLARRVQEVDERQAEAQMDGPLQLRVEHAERRRVELEDGERDGNGGDDFRHDALVHHRVGFFVVFL